MRKAAIVAGAISAALWGSAALASDATCPTPSKHHQEASGEGGSGAVQYDECGCPIQGTGGSAQQQAAPLPQECQPQASTGGSGYSEAFAPAPEVKKSTHEHTPLRGVGVALGAGVEGYSGALAPQLSPGPTWGVNVDLRPTKVLGLELQYSGATHNVRNAPDLASGADIVRNGGQAAAKFGLTATAIQPYVMGGIGFSHYNVRGATELEGFRDDTVGTVPVGVGLRTQVGRVYADARAGYDFLWSQDFSPGRTNSGNTSGGAGSSYSGTLNVGGVF